MIPTPRAASELARRAALLTCLFAGMALGQSPSLRPADISDAEKLNNSSQALKRMDEVMRQVFGKLKEARDQHDVVKAACVNEYLTQIKALVRISGQADVSMQEAIATRNSARAENEYIKLTIAPRRVEELRAKAEECMGQLAFQTVGLTVEVEEPKDLPRKDVTNPEGAPPPYARPPPASPTL
jgi:hypothetical protein